MKNEISLIMRLIWTTEWTTDP